MDVSCPGVQVILAQEAGFHTRRAQGFAEAEFSIELGKRRATQKQDSKYALSMMATSSRFHATRTTACTVADHGEMKVLAASDAGADSKSKHTW